MSDYKLTKLIGEIDKYLKETILGEEEDIRVSFFTVVPRDKVVQIDYDDDDKEDIPEGSTHLLIECDIYVGEGVEGCYQGNKFWVHIDDEDAYFTDDIDDVLGCGVEISDATLGQAMDWIEEVSQGSPVYIVDDYGCY